MTPARLPLTELAGAPASLLASVLALNEGVQHLTSPLGPDRLAALIGWAEMAVAVPDGRGGADAFLIGIPPGSAYDSPNYRWFAERLDRFAYIDRVVVAPRAQGRGLARALYDAYAARVAARGSAPLACEVNSHPPNPGSDAFHATLGFAEMGRGSPAPGKVVRYLVRPGD
ncbi:MAG TPA: GNAT family N-acetyltransferase [Paracoccaceae bacterium]|nr:GNAT family N-acetyltransferase [Paracoccaceae bacterium]